MAMTVELGDMKPVVDDLVASGRYGSEADVLKDGIRLLQAREERLAELYAALDVGIASADAGHLIPIDDVRDEIIAEIRSRSKAA